MYMIFLLTQIWLVAKIFHEILTRPTLDGVAIISKIVTTGELAVIEIAGDTIGIRGIASGGAGVCRPTSNIACGAEVDIIRVEREIIIIRVINYFGVIGL